MKQTAVEWLINQFLEANTDSVTNENMYIKLSTKALQQAKEMEKEQIKNAYYTGGDDVEDNRDREAEQYYKENYESKTNI